MGDVDEVALTVLWAWGVVGRMAGHAREADPRIACRCELVGKPEERPKGPLALPFLGGQVRPNIIKLGGGYLPSLSEASSASGSGGMASDSGALALWGYLLFGRHPLSEESLRTMTDFSKGEHHDQYALGVSDQTNMGDGFLVPAIGNGGCEEDGYSSSMTALPSKGIVISVLTNTAGDPRPLVLPIAQELASVLQTGKAR